MPMELHVVHFKSDYETQDAALRKDDGITILVYLFQVLKRDLYLRGKSTLREKLVSNL